VREVYIDDDTREAIVVVPDDQLALAIGKEGLNARLAARLTGWKVDIQSDTEFAQAEAEAAFAGAGADDDDYSGRCAAILSNGKRCPNAALPGTKYCGVPAHQALAQTGATNVSAELTEEQIAQEEAAVATAERSQGGEAAEPPVLASGPVEGVLGQPGGSPGADLTPAAEDRASDEQLARPEEDQAPSGAGLASEDLTPEAGAQLDAATDEIVTDALEEAVVEEAEAVAAEAVVEAEEASREE